MSMIRSVITTTGSYIPDKIVPNTNFLEQLLLQKDGGPIPGNKLRNIEKFQAITGIAERRYAKPLQKASDLATLASMDALKSASIDKEMLDYIIVAHNFGDVTYGSYRTDIVPALASRVKFQLQIKNPACVAYDLVFGCPGWLQGLIQADYYIRPGDARSCLVIGSETLSRVTEVHDRDSMIYADGAVIVEASNKVNMGVLSHISQTFAIDHAMLLTMDKSYQPGQDDGAIFIKMDVRALYEFALTHVPAVIKQLLDKAQISLTKVKKVLIHQANEKMDQAILERLFNLYNVEKIPDNLMPMTISWLANSSVATIPTLLDLVLKNKMEGHFIEQSDKVVFASVGAGRNINALLYQF